MLPTFLDKEPKGIALAFGTGRNATYEIVKNRIIEVQNASRSLGKNKVTDFFATSRSGEETLMCYAIRLETLAQNLPDASGDMQKHL